MKIRIIPSSIEASEEMQYLTSYVINNNVAIDAGSLGIYSDPEFQNRISHIFLTHAHIDHVGSLPIFAENTYGRGQEGICVLGSAETLQTIRDNIFNDRIWPSFLLKPLDKGGYLKLEILKPEQPIHIHGLTFTAVAVEHKVATYGYIAEDEKGAVVFGSDSGPTRRIWEIARDLPRLKAVFLESSFPNDMNELAVATGHLTPTLLKKEAKKLPAKTRIIATHIKPNFRTRVVEELHNLELSHLEIGSSGKEYIF
jgi:cAMP phosphodiesterase